MDAIAALAAKLALRSDLDWTRGDRWVRIEAACEGGFVVELRHQDDEWNVYLGKGGWHQHFEDADEALNFIAWCYSGEARVREVWRGRSPQKAALEALDNGAWRLVSETGLIFFPFWRKRHEVVLENPNLIVD